MYMPKDITYIQGKLDNNVMSKTSGLPSKEWMMAASDSSFTLDILHFVLPFSALKALLKSVRAPVIRCLTEGSVSYVKCFT